MQDNKKINKILKILKSSYPKATIALNFSNPLELLISVILSAQCTDKMVNIVTDKLFKKYKTLDDYLKADILEFEKDIRSTGFYHNKAKNILETVKMIKEKFGGKVPGTMEELITLKGVARKTANIVLGNAYNVVVGIPVDTHVSRISQRLRLVDLEKIGGKRKVMFSKQGSNNSRGPSTKLRTTQSVDFKKDADANKIEKELMNIIPKEDWITLSYEIINHGRAVCKAKNPNCGDCPLSELCPASRA